MKGAAGAASERGRHFIEHEDLVFKQSAYYERHSCMRLLLRSYAALLKTTCMPENIVCLRSSCHGSAVSGEVSLGEPLSWATHMPGNCWKGPCAL